MVELYLHFLVFLHGIVRFTDFSYLYQKGRKFFPETTSDQVGDHSLSFRRCEGGLVCAEKQSGLKPVVVKKYIHAPTGNQTPTFKP
jgi:hypothetical protein